MYILTTDGHAAEGGGGGGRFSVPPPPTLLLLLHPAASDSSDRRPCKTHTHTHTHTLTHQTHNPAELVVTPLRTDGWQQEQDRENPSIDFMFGGTKENRHCAFRPFFCFHQTKWKIRPQRLAGIDYFFLSFFPLLLAAGRRRM